MTAENHHSRSFISIATLCVVVWLLLDPLYMGYDQFRVNRDVGPVKYIIPCLALVCLVNELFRISICIEKRLSLNRLLFRAVPLLVFCSIVITGSLYAKMVDDISANFLQLGIAGLTGYLFGALLVIGDEGLDGYARTLFTALGIALVYEIPMMLMKRLEAGQAFHTEIFTILPTICYWALNSKTAKLRLLLIALMGVVALILHKNIGYIVFAICFWAIAADVDMRRTVLVGRATMFARLWVGAFFAVIGTALLIARTSSSFTKLAPSGSIEIRSIVYKQMIDKFLSSPWYGDIYSGTAHVELAQYQVLGNFHVTSHSDWLDSLAHGGLIGFILLSMACVFPLIGGMSKFYRGRSLGQARAGACLWALSASGVVTCAFVSMLSALPVAFVFWAAVGAIAADSDAKVVT